MYPVSLGAQHPGSMDTVSNSMPSPPVSGIVPTVLRDAAERPVALGRDRGIVGKRGSNAPALGRDGAGVLFDLFPHTKEGHGPSAHSESEGGSAGF